MYRTPEPNNRTQAKGIWLSTCGMAGLAVAQTQFGWASRILQPVFPSIFVLVRRQQSTSPPSDGVGEGVARTSYRRQQANYLSQDVVVPLQQPRFALITRHRDD